MLVSFYSAEDGEELAELELTRVPSVGEFVMIDGRGKRVKAVDWTITKNMLEAVHVHVRDLKPTDGWRR